MSHKLSNIVVTPAVGTTPATVAATVTDVTIADYFTTLLSSDSVLVGTAKYIQTAGIVLGSMIVSNKLHGADYFQFKS